MTEKPMTVPMTRVEFATTPGTAPEIRGGNGYFTPTCPTIRALDEDGGE